MKSTARIIAAAAAAAIYGGAAAQSLDNALAAYSQLDLDGATEILDRLKPAARKGNEDAIEQLRERITLASDMLARVQQLEILDSMTVAADDFFRAYKLHPSTGRLATADVVAGADSFEIVEPVYVSENGDDMIWVGYDSSEAEYPAMMESVRLADGSWEAPARLFTRADIFGDGIGGALSAPMLMADGVTVYFAADGPASLGGLDIFMARRNADGFLQPTNVGMPYNSPADDYMMVIDEATGLGWWATNRNAAEGEVTIYIFAPSEMRVNYPADTEGLADIAMMRTVEFPADRGERLAVLRDLMPARTETDEFCFALPDGSVATCLTDFNNAEARDMMEDYLTAEKDLKSALTILAHKRLLYGRGQHDLADDILAAEADIDRRRSELKSLRSAIARAESR